MIYLDHAATTPLDKDVLKEMLPFFSEDFGNANSQHTYGQKAASAVIKAREEIAECLNAKPSEIYFTSGGTEADNWALKGVALAHKDKGRHIITSKIEHSAIYASCKQLETLGFEVTYLDVDSEGFVSSDTLKNAIKNDTILVSIMFANNEIGTIEPIKELCAIAHEKGVLFHTDAVQAAGSVKLDVKDLGVDLMSISSHKFYGPKGVGALYVRNGVKIEKLISGGEQERSKRGGTTNVPGVVGMAKALKKACSKIDENAKYVSSLRDRFVLEVESKIEMIKFNGPRHDRLPNNASFSFRFIEGESILFSLDLRGVCASSGSACSSGSLEPSRTLMAIGVPVGTAHGTIRFSFGKHNTVEEVDKTVEILADEVNRLRQMSPLFKQDKEKKEYV